MRKRSPMITFIQAHILSITTAYTVDKNYRRVCVITAVNRRHTDNKFLISIRNSIIIRLILAVNK